jgi:hypothetical protein
MKLTIQDKKLLANWGERPDDIAQIERASKSNILELELKDLETSKRRKIGQREAIKILGRETFLSGLSRAAFHWSSSRESEDEKFSVSFYCGKLFKEE